MTSGSHFPPGKYKVMFYVICKDHSSISILNLLVLRSHIFQTLSLTSRCQKSIKLTMVKNILLICHSLFNKKGAKICSIISRNVSLNFIKYLLAT